MTFRPAVSFTSLSLCFICFDQTQRRKTVRVFRSRACNPGSAITQPRTLANSCLSCTCDSSHANPSLKYYFCLNKNDLVQRVFQLDLSWLKPESLLTQELHETFWFLFHSIVQKCLFEFFRPYFCICKLNLQYKENFNVISFFISSFRNSHDGF